MIVMTAGEEDGQDDHRKDETPRFAKRCRIAGCPANGNRHEHEQQPDGCRKVVARGGLALGVKIDEIVQRGGKKRDSRRIVRLHLGECRTPHGDLVLLGTCDQFVVFL